jgi:hypothetical protein
MLCCVGDCAVSDVFQDCCSFMFRFKRSTLVEGDTTLKNVRNYSPNDKTYIPEDLTLQQHCCEDLKSHNANPVQMQFSISSWARYFTSGEVAESEHNTAHHG